MPEAGRETLEVEGTVRWYESGDEPEGAGLGIRLDGLRARDIWALSRFFQQPR